jgi:hypothetical protein
MIVLKIAIHDDYNAVIMQLCNLVVRILATDPEVPGSIPWAPRLPKE